MTSPRCKRKAGLSEPAPALKSVAISSEIFSASSAVLTPVSPRTWKRSSPSLWISSTPAAPMMSLKLMTPSPLTGGTGPNCCLLQSVIRLLPLIGWRASGGAGRKNGCAYRAREYEVEVLKSLGAAIGLRDIALLREKVRQAVRCRRELPRRVHVAAAKRVAKHSCVWKFRESHGPIHRVREEHPKRYDCTVARPEQGVTAHRHGRTRFSLTPPFSPHPPAPDTTAPRATCTRPTAAAPSRSARVRATRSAR